MYPSCDTLVACFLFFKSIFQQFNIKTVIWLLQVPTSQQPVGPIALNVGGYRRRQPVKSRSDVWVGLLVGWLVVVVGGGWVEGKRGRGL